jgi:hypothetical protein
MFPRPLEFEGNADEQWWARRGEAEEGERRGRKWHSRTTTGVASPLLLCPPFALAFACSVAVCCHSSLLVCYSAASKHAQPQGGQAGNTTTQTGTLTECAERCVRYQILNPAQP